MAVAYSSQLKGVGMANGGVVWCAEGAGSITTDVQTRCISDPSSINVGDTVTVLSSLASSGAIDVLSGLTSLPLYFFHTQNDTFVVPDTTQINENLFD